MSRRSTIRSLTAIGAIAVTAVMLAGCSAGGSSSDGGPTQLTLYMGAGVPDDIKTAETLAANFNAANPDVVVTVDPSGPEGADLDSSMKTKLATDDMADMFWYNSGAQMQALNPDQTLLNVASEPWIANLDDTYKGTVSTSAGTYGAPVGSAMGGGMFYNKKVFSDLGLKVPTTWDELMANNQKIKAAGIAPVIQSYGDTWTAQMVILADFFNVYAVNSDFGTQLTKNEVTFAGTPAATESFVKLQDLADAGDLNQDFATTTLDQALSKLAKGEGAQYPMLTFAEATIVQNYPDQVKDIGFFAIPGASASSNGLTTWMPSSVYAPKNTPHPDEVKRFMAYVASVDGCNSITEARGVTGPYVVDGCKIDGDVPPVVADMLPYFEKGDIAPALEFLSPVKGPNLYSISVEVGSGIRSGADAAKAYDQDNQLQGQQLGLPGF